MAGFRTFSNWLRRLDKPEPLGFSSIKTKSIKGTHISGVEAIDS